MNSPKLVAEIGCNHGGDFDQAVEMICVLTEFCGVEYIKFQKRNPSECLTLEEYNYPHPDPANSYGETYGRHREKLEFTVEQHQQLQYQCQRHGAKYGCSVWDLTSLNDILTIKPDFIKVPSACSTWYAMHEILCHDYPGKIHVSTGMTTEGEIRQLDRFYLENRRYSDVVFYHCTSAYPVEAEDLGLRTIAKFQKSSMVTYNGFSGHHKGISLDIAAYTLGAEWIERHFTLDRTTKGTDHAASLEPDGMRRLKRDLEACHQALTFKASILDCEQDALRKLKWNRNQKQS